MSAGPVPAGSRKVFRLDWVDTGRGLAIVLVALFHSTNWLSGPGLDLQWWTDFNSVVSSMRMPTFFMLAGLFAQKWVQGSWSAVLTAKVRLFLWVFLVWEVIGTATFMLGQHASGVTPNVLAAIRDLVISPVSPRFELWFIWALALFFVVARATRRIDSRVQLAAVGTVSVVALTLWSDSTTGWTGSAKFYFFFLAGLYLRRHILALADRARVWSIVSVLVVWAGLSWFFFAAGIRGVFGIYFVNCVLGVLAGMALGRALSRLTLLRRLGTQTLPIYLAHTPIVILLSFLISLPALYRIVEPVTPVVPLVGTAVAVSLSLGLRRLCRRPPFDYLYEPPAGLLDPIGRWIARLFVRRPIGADRAPAGEHGGTIPTSETTEFPGAGGLSEERGDVGRKTDRD
ncbi:acyltransferase family protein [Nakamurella sp. YIM 132087]|uniref:Acyltransferase family protein n=1 Tax=Nakamurella alba TaxID=2665158 RepID=A0A7K1FIN7_9ACTN|nr:acyltransferase [Nakamurella alba]MTD12754.1 acyltransferase family protein [Nakamurella alba]